MHIIYIYIYIYIHRNHKTSDDHVTSCNMLLSASSGRDVRSEPVSRRKLVSSYVTRIPHGLLLKLRESGRFSCWITRRGTNYDNRSRGGTWAFDISVSRLKIISQTHGMLVRFMRRLFLGFQLTYARLLHVVHRPGEWQVLLTCSIHAAVAIF